MLCSIVQIAYDLFLCLSPFNSRYMNRILMGSEHIVMHQLNMACDPVYRFNCENPPIPAPREKLKPSIDSDGMFGLPVQESKGFYDVDTSPPSILQPTRSSESDSFDMMLGFIKANRERVEAEIQFNALSCIGQPVTLANPSFIPVPEPMYIPPNLAEKIGRHGHYSDDPEPLGTLSHVPFIPTREEIWEPPNLAEKIGRHGRYSDDPELSPTPLVGISLYDIPLHVLEQQEVRNNVEKMCASLSDGKANNSIWNKPEPSLRLHEPVDFSFLDKPIVSKFEPIAQLHLRCEPDLILDKPEPPAPLFSYRERDFTLPKLKPFVPEPEPVLPLTLKRTIPIPELPEIELPGFGRTKSDPFSLPVTTPLPVAFDVSRKLFIPEFKSTAPLDIDLKDTIRSLRTNVRVILTDRFHI